MPPRHAHLMAPALATLLSACSEPSPASVEQPGEAVPATRTSSSASPPAVPAPVADAARGNSDVVDGAAGNVVPRRFLGRYAGAPALCGGDFDERRLVLSADAVEFYESGGPVVRTRADGDVLHAVFRLSGEGETWEREYSFRLEDAGRVLVDTASGLARVRCD